MIIAVSIVDRHKPGDDKHVGTYIFEVDHPAAIHQGQISLMVADYPAEEEDKLRPLLGRLLKRHEIPNVVDGEGNPI